MTKNPTRTLTLVAFFLWIIALLMLLGVFLALNIDTFAANGSDTQQSAVGDQSPALETLERVSGPQSEIAPHAIPFPEGSLDHAFYPLVGAHAVLECTACHADLSYAGAPTDCVSCHADTAPLEHYDGDCALCHSPEAWSAVVFNHSAIDTSDCQSCHIEKAPVNHFPGQ